MQNITKVTRRLSAKARDLARKAERKNHIVDLHMWDIMQRYNYAVNGDVKYVTEAVAS